MISPSLEQIEVLSFRAAEDMFASIHLKHHKLALLLEVQQEC